MNVGRNELLIGMAVLVIGLLIATPLLLSSGHAGRLEQVREHVESLRAAELDHHEAFGAYVSAEAAPRPADQVSAEPVVWVPTPGFIRLAWAPDPQDQVWASFAVAITSDGFRVTGISDLDGDGEHALIEATQESPAVAASPRGIY